jgi:hypothetical protein
MIEKLKQNVGYQEKSIPVSTRDEARKVINNKINFIKMIFEQSTDPYFGTPRWSEYCLKLNSIGTPIETTNGIQVFSTLVLNSVGEPGYCSDAETQTRSHVVYIYCEGSKRVLEITYPFGPVTTPLHGDMCAN